ncbi:hypothetical protein ACV566_14040 [Staphylococcus aureus]
MPLVQLLRMACIERGACIVGAIFVISYLYWYCKKIKKDPESVIFL